MNSQQLDSAARQALVMFAFKECLESIEDNSMFKCISCKTKVEETITLKDGRTAQITVEINTDEDNFI